MAPVKRPEESVTVCRPRLVDVLSRSERESITGVRRPLPPGKAIKMYIHDPAWELLRATLVNPPKTIGARLKAVASRIWSAAISLIVGGQ